MSRRSYPEYNPSGVKWLGDVPEPWSIYRLKYCATLVNDKIDGADCNLPYTGLEHIESWTGKRINGYAESSSSEGQANRYRQGDVLFGKLRPYLAKVMRTGEEGICTGELLVLRPKLVQQNYLFNFMLTCDFISIVDSSTYGAKMPRANWEFIGNLPTLVPPGDEQRTIAVFLDRETKRIDTLIEKKQRQIELLQEKRAAVISHAITKGLDPNVKMKPSSIEWLGEISEHWEVVRFKYVLWLQRGHDLPVTEFQEGEYPVCGSNGCIGYHSQYTTKGPGVTVGRSGSVGEVNYVDTDYWAHNTTLYVKGFRRATQRYSFYLLKTLDLKCLSEGTAVGTLNRNYIHDLFVAIPVVAEQRNIASFLDRETEQIDTLIGKVRKSINLLREYRTAIISAAVTGKIDVRKEGA